MESNHLYRTSCSAARNDQPALSAIVRAGSAQRSLSKPSSEVPLASIPHHAVDISDGEASLAQSANHASVSDLGTASSIPTLSSKARRKGPFGAVMNFVITSILLLIAVSSMILSLGLPYWYFSCYYFDTSSRVASAEKEKGDYDDHSQLTMHWNKVLCRLKSQWKAFFAISAGALPAVFPMLAIYRDPKCSWASLVAALSLFSGLMSMCAAQLYLHSSDTLHEGLMALAWHKASQPPWLRFQSTSRFWVFMSLPAVWLFNQIITLIITIMFAIWEQAAVPSAEGTCISSRLHLFRILTLLALSVAVAHVIFFMLAVGSFRGLK